MRYLLDTHIVIWAMVGSEMLSDKALDILHSSGNTFYLSSASVWEVAIKHSAKPNEIPVTAEQVVRFCRESGIVELPVGFRHSLVVSGLPPHHGDPFDRMIVAQAIEEGMSILSHDGKLPPYGDFVVRG